MSQHDVPTPESVMLGVDRPTPEQEADAQKTRDDKAKVRRLFLLGLMENPLFREWLMEQLQGLQTFSQPYAVTPTGFPDEMATQFQMGMKAAGWHLWDQFDSQFPELASLLRREAAQPQQKI